MDAAWFALLDRAVDVLAAGRGLRGRRRERLLLAVDFPTWRTLTSSCLDYRGAAEVAGAIRRGRRRRRPGRRRAAVVHP
jgi:hypothetical protein